MVNNKDREPHTSAQKPNQIALLLKKRRQSKASTDQILRTDWKYDSAIFVCGVGDRNQGFTHEC